MGRRLTAAWDVRGINIATIKVDPSGTLSPPHSSRDDFDDIEDLPTMVTGADPQRLPQVELGDVIGEGGMGLVWGAIQTPLAREVAVKSLRPDADAESLAGLLLQEARITGALEHPNIVPIHALGRDESGRPLIIMKLIDGFSWEELLHNQHQQGLAVVLEELPHHLDILLDVANAIHFAHARGIVHRDIKPGNVMIGTFGEVYVVDWGIAAGIGDGKRRAAPVPTGDVILGSPAYMAPEMAVADNAAINALTDVYLLGATLCDVLTGQPPHDANTVRMMLTRAYASEPPTFADEVPEGLVDICRKAMSRDPADRYQSADTFANAVDLFLSHRSSTVLSDEASVKLETLRDVLSVSEPTESEAQRKLYNLFNEVRFACVYALRIWDGNGRAREQLQVALELMIRYEVRNGAANAAAALIGALPSARPRLAERVEQTRLASARHSRELMQLREAADPTLQDRKRAVHSFLIALGWAAGHLLLWLLDRNTSFEVAHLEWGTFFGLFFMTAVLFGLARREFLAKVVSGWPTQFAVILAHGCGALSWLIGQLLGLTVVQTFALMSFVISTAWASSAVSVDRRFLVRVVTSLGGLVGWVLWPQQTILWVGLSGTLGSIIMGALRLRASKPQDVSPLSHMWSQPRAQQ